MDTVTRGRKGIDESIILLFLILLLFSGCHGIGFGNDILFIFLILFLIGIF